MGTVIDAADSWRKKVAYDAIEALSSRDPGDRSLFMKLSDDLSTLLGKVQLRIMHGETLSSSLINETYMEVQSALNHDLEIRELINGFFLNPGLDKENAEREVLAELWYAYDASNKKIRPLFVLS